jgi:hypothetical protein
MALISLLEQAIKKLPDSMKVESIRNTLLKSGVKDLEINASEVLDDSWHSWDADGNSLLPENGRLTREQLQKRLAQRGDQTSVIEDQSFSRVTLPLTSPTTYRTRVYKNPQLSIPGTNHWNTPDYIMHTRSDVINVDTPNNNKATLTKSLLSQIDSTGAQKYTPEEALQEATQRIDRAFVTPTFGDAALRIQEIQSDLANQAINNDPASITKVAKSVIGDAVYNYRTNYLNVLGNLRIFAPTTLEPRLLIAKTTTYLKNLGYTEEEARAFAERRLELVLKGDDLNIPYDKQRPAVKKFLIDAHGISESKANEILDDIDLGHGNEPGHYDLANDVSHLEPINSDDLFDDAFEYVSSKQWGDLSLEEARENFDDDMVPFVAEYLVKQKGLSVRQAEKIASEIEPGEIVDFKKILTASPKKFEVPYIRQALFHELERAQQDGISEVQIAINPAHVDQLHRSSGVQKNYETTVKNTAEKIAKQIGAEVKFDRGFLILGLPAAGFTLPLYAQDGVPMAEDKDQSFIKTATDLGHSEQEAKDTLFRRKAKQAGYDDAKIDEILTQRNTATSPTAAIPATGGLPNGEQAMAVPVENEQPPIMTVPVQQKETVVNGIVQRLEGESTREFAARLNENHPELRFTNGLSGKDDILNPPETSVDIEQQKASAYVSELQQSLSVARPYLELTSWASKENHARLDAYNNELGKAVTDLAQAKSINLTYEDNTYYVTDKNGNKIEATPDIMQDLWGTKGEMSGAMLGASVGFAYTPGPAILKLVGGVVGGAIGSVVGTELDYMNAAISTHQELSSKLAFEKGLGAAEASMTYDVLFGAAIKGASYGIKLSKVGWQTLNHGYELVKNGNRDGAYKVLTESLDMDDDKVKQVIDLWEKVNGMKVPGNNIKEQALAVLPTTSPGGQDILEAVSRDNPAASSAIQRDVAQRAQSLLDASDEIADDDAARRVISSLRTFVDDASLMLSSTKSQFVNGTTLDLVDKPNYVEPMENMFSSIIDHLNIDAASRGGYQFISEAKMPQMMAKAENLTTPNDLIELRNSLNELKYSKSIRNTLTLQKIDSVLELVDGHIEQVAKSSMGEVEGQNWLDMWDLALEGYSKSLVIQKNGLFNAMTKKTTAGKPIRNDVIARALINYGPSIDDAYIRRGGEAINTYDEVIDELPTNTVRDVEGLIVQGMVEKWTSGQKGGLRATQFPALSEALSVYDFRSAEAQRLKTVVEELGSLYKNDVPIAAATGAISFQPFQSYLTTNPIVRAKFAIASGIFNYVSTLKGGAQADTRAMINWVGKMLAEPLNPRTTAHVIEEVKQDQTVAKAIEDYQKELAASKARGEPDTLLQVKTYRDKQGNLFSNPAKGLTASESIAGKSIARDEYVNSKFGTTTDALTRYQKAELINEGFEAVMTASGQITRLF